MAALTKFAELFQLLQGLVPPVQPPATDRPAGSTSPFSAQDFVDALLDRAFWPLPKKGNSKKKIPAETCPISGLKRDALYELFQLKRLDGLPLIETVSMREGDEERGTRLYCVGSVLRHLREKARRQAEEERNKKKTP